jgi:hypothetical protein
MINRVSTFICFDLSYFAGFGFFWCAQVPHVPPSFLQCLQDVQLRHALQGSAPVQVAAPLVRGIQKSPTVMKDNRSSLTRCF